MTLTPENPDDADHCRPIGVIHSCFKQKFGIPRQPGLISEARATLEFFPPYDRPEAFTGLTEFSHLWIIFRFHQNPTDRAFKLTVRPPRLGGNSRLGVFATRSPYRPNPLGLSVVELEAIDSDGHRTRLKLKGVDLVDGTPVLDIKPYLPYVDRIDKAHAGFAEEPPPSPKKVLFSQTALAACRDKERASYPGLEALISQILSCDPRPAYRQQQDSQRTLGMRLYDFDLRWRVDGETITVTELADLD